MISNTTSLLLDGALQTVLGIAAEAEAVTPYVPFALDNGEILRPLTAICYAYAEMATSEHSRSGDIRQCNSRLLSEGADALVRLNRFYVRALGGANARERVTRTACSHRSESWP
ncbi:MAG: polyketide synthase dehydratase domain-containing protein [Steroidobacteraceae bacterium]